MIKTHQRKNLLCVGGIILVLCLAPAAPGPRRDWESPRNVARAMTTPEGTITIDESDVFLDFLAGRYVEGSETLDFRLFRPPNFGNGDAYPLIIFLHGAGDRGDDNKRQVGTTTHKDGIRPWIDPVNQAEHPAFILAPQCPIDNMWVDSHWYYGSYDLDAVPESDELAQVVHIVNYLVETYAIDENRIFVTGYSMGGMGTWDLLLRHPDMFVAGMPVCGCGSPEHASNIKDIPIWNFHGALDNTISVQCSRDMVNALNAIDGDVQYTEYPNGYHDVWRYAYYEPETIDWAYSYIDPTPALELSGAPADQAAHLTWRVNVALPVTSTWQIDYYTQTIASTVIVTDALTNTADAYTLTGLFNYTWYTVTLSTVGVTPPLSGTIRVMPTDRLVHLPLVSQE